MKLTITIEAGDELVINSLCKSCGKPVELLRKSGVPTTPSLTVHTGLSRVHPVLPVPDVRDRGTGEPASSTLNATPFPTLGLTPDQESAVHLMVAFFRLRGTLEPLEHGEFNDELYKLAVETLSDPPERDRVLAEAWSPRFWRTRPEFTVGPETIAPVPAILEPPTPAPAPVPCATGHTWTSDREWDPEPGTPCDCGAKKWGRVPEPEPPFFSQ